MMEKCEVLYGGLSIPGFVQMEQDGENGLPGYLVVFYEWDTTREERKVLGWKKGKAEHLAWFPADKVKC